MLGTRQDQRPKMRVNFIGEDLDHDFQTFIQSVPKEINAYYLDKPVGENSVIDEDKGLFIYVHNWIVGRLDVTSAMNRMRNAEQKLKCKVDAILVLRGPNHKGTDVALISFTKITIGHVAIEMGSIYPEDKGRFLALIKQWYSNRKIHSSVVNAGSIGAAGIAVDYANDNLPVKPKSFFSSLWAGKSQDSAKEAALLKAIKANEQKFMLHCTESNDYDSLEKFANSMKKNNYLSADAIINEVLFKQARPS